MTERDAFMQAIIEAPGDDAPRLIYADWLEEHGESERAEFIRVQIQSESKPCIWAKSYNVEYCADKRCRGCRLLRDRANDLFYQDTAHRRQWANGVNAEWIDNGVLAYRRGFISEITLTCADWLAHREELLRACPLEKVTLTGWGYAVYAARVINGELLPSLYIRPDLGSGALLPFALSVRNGTLRDIVTNRQVVALSPEEHNVLCGNPNAPRPQGLIHAASSSSIRANIEVSPDGEHWFPPTV